MKKRISRNDVIFLAILLAVVTVFLVIYERTGMRADAGACVRVTVDGSVYGTYALGEEQEIPIVPVSYTHLDVYKRQIQSGGRAGADDEEHDGEPCLERECEEYVRRIVPSWRNPDCE